MIHKKMRFINQTNMKIFIYVKNCIHQIFKFLIKKKKEKELVVKRCGKKKKKRLKKLRLKKKTC